MKKYCLIAFFIVLMLMSTYGCDNITDRETLENTTGNASTLNVNDVYKFNDDGYLTNFYASLDTYVETDSNYNVRSNKMGIEEHYFVFDNKGNLLDEGYSPYGVEFVKENDFLTMKYYTNATELNRVRYFDLENGKVSRFFTNSLGTSHELVAYFTWERNNELVLIVQDVFDEEIYYEEIKREFSVKVDKELCPIEFLNNNSELKISYWTNPNDEIETEIIKLNVS